VNIAVCRYDEGRIFFCVLMPRDSSFFRGCLSVAFLRPKNNIKGNKTIAMWSKQTKKNGGWKK